MTFSRTTAHWIEMAEMTGSLMNDMQEGKNSGSD
jgi:hypothetical protein